MPKHHHFDIIQAYYSDPDKWELYYDSSIQKTWHIAGPHREAWLPTLSYKLVLKEKKKTVPSRRFIYKDGAENFYVGHALDKRSTVEKMNAFVRWVDDDWIEYDVDVDSENEIVSMARGS
jgi:hypothetical protein